MAVEDTSANEVVFVSCAGDGAPNPYFFDQNGEFWSGNTRIADASDVIGHEYEIQVWEDDGGRCDGVNNLKPDTDLSLPSLVTSGFKPGNRIREELDEETQGIVQIGESIWNIVNEAYDFASGLFDDDLVGVLERLPHGCYEEATGQHWYCSGSGVIGLLG